MTIPKIAVEKGIAVFGEKIYFLFRKINRKQIFVIQNFSIQIQYPDPVHTREKMGKQKQLTL